MLGNIGTTTRAGAGAALAALLLSGCGLGSDDVAKVGRHTVTKAEFAKEQRLMFALQVGSQLYGKGFKPLDVIAPYDNCADYLKRTEKVAKGKKAPTVDELKVRCKKIDTDKMRSDTLGFIVQNLMVEDLSKDMGIDVSEKDVDKVYAQAFQQVVGNKANLAKFKLQTGGGEELLRDAIKRDLISQKISAKATEGADQVSDSDVKAYYNKNKAQFTTQGYRDLRLILTKTEDEANQAKKLVEGGTKWSTVADKFSKDTSTRVNKGVLANAQQGQQERELDKAAFSAKKGELVGPVKTENGFYLVQPIKIIDEVVQPFEQMKEQIKMTLAQQNLQERGTRWQTQLASTWQTRTKCAKDYENSPVCSTYKAPEGQDAAQQPGAQPAQQPAG